MRSNEPDSAVVVAVVAVAVSGGQWWSVVFSDHLADYHILLPITAWHMA